MNVSAIVSALVACVLVVPFAAGNHGGASAECPPYSRYVPEDSESRSYPVYVAWDENPYDYMPWVWIYAESNGEVGLQRHDNYCHHEDADGRPYTRETADTIVF